MTDNFYKKTERASRLALSGLVCIVLLWGCAITSGTPERPRMSGTTGGGIYHTVKKGETLWRISKEYGVSVKDLAAANNIHGPADLDAGKRIFIPNASAAKSSGKRVKNVKRHTATPVAVEKDRYDNGRVAFNREKFLWPVKGSLASHFGLRDGVRNDGIDIRVPEGTPVKAADAGQVAYISTNMRGYGNIIILKHRDGFYTVYAHNKNNLVNSGDSVDKGAVIATAGATGNTETAQLHFEVRHGKRTLDPLYYLP